MRPKVKESEIRDLVAANLSRIDPKLSLVGVEQEVRMPDGRYAKIDILAKDKFGCFTVIEIKKSEQTARSTVQQLYTYASYLKARKRLRSDQIRCVALSTHWHGLSAPFSEFKHFSEYQSIALMIQIKNNDYSVEEVECRYEEGGADPLSNFVFFEFKSESERNNSLSLLTEALDNFCPGLNSIIVKCKTSPDQEIINPFGYSWSIFRSNSTDIDHSMRLISSLNSSSDDYTPFGSEPESDDDREANLRAAILKNCDLCKGGGEYAFFAIHTLNNTLVRWEREGIIRHGHMFDDNDTEEELIEIACGFVGHHPYIFRVRATPERPSHFNYVRSKLKLFLSHNQNWQKGVEHILASVPADAEVRIQIYNPMNFCGMIEDLRQYNKTSRIPRLTIEVESGESKNTYTGALIWGGLLSAVRLRDAIKRAFPSEGLAQARLVNQWINQYDEKLFRIFCLKHEIMLVRSNGFDWLNTEESPPKLQPSTKDLKSLQKFFDLHPRLFKESAHLFGNVINMADLRKFPLP
jgi:hypothetical protein